jgi:hypothetical protein
MSGLRLQHSFRSLRLSDIIFNLDKATLRVPKYESEAGVGSRYSDLEGARRFVVRTPMGSTDFLFLTSVCIGPQWVRGPFPGTKAVRRVLARPTASTPTLTRVELYIYAVPMPVYRVTGRSLPLKGSKISLCLSVLPYSALTVAPCTCVGGQMVSS